MFVLGVTGGIGTGKSTVSGILRDRGLLVLDADQISKDVTDVDGIANEEIAQVFGNRAIRNNALDRKYISSIVFNDKTKLDKLSSIIHKYVLKYIADQLEKERTKGTKCVVLDVPIPVEKGFVDKCNQIWVVTCDTEIKLRRLVDRGMTLDDAKRRIAMQMTDEEYLNIGDYEINNSGSFDDLITRVEELIKEQLYERGIRI
ncbi:MAG: dephospho-CoA kinase [Clostridiales bacterium]|nr:dephospho-CoA kinase [Clostridiales bacterium]